MNARDTIIATIRSGVYVDEWIAYGAGGVQVDAEPLADAIVRDLIAAGFDLSDRPTVDVDRRPHSRACGWGAHPHGSSCAKDCPTCHPDGWR